MCAHNGCSCTTLTSSSTHGMQAYEGTLLALRSAGMGGQAEEEVAARVAGGPVDYVTASTAYHFHGDHLLLTGNNR